MTQRNGSTPTGLTSPLARGLFALLLLIASSPHALASGFFDGPAASAGEPMFFSIYSVRKEQRGNFNLARISDGGFTTAGPHYLGGNGGDPLSHPGTFYQNAADATEEGLGSIAHITWHPDVVNDTSGFVRDNSMNAISEADIRAHVRQVMDFTLDDPTTNASTHKWYTLPEELRPWRSAEMRYLNIVADEIRQYDPLGRPISMYNPNNRSASQLTDITGQGLDETLMGVYVTTEPSNTRGPRVALGVERIVDSAQTTSTTPVVGLQLSRDFDTGQINSLRSALGGASEAEAIKHLIRHDTYQSIMRGIEGVQIWSGCDCRNGLTTYSEQLDGYISVSSDMNNELRLADVFLRGEDREDLSATVLSGPTAVSYDGGLGQLTIDTVTVSDIAYGGDRYLFLANSSNSQLEVRVDGLPAGVTASQFGDLFDNAPELTVDSIAGEILLDLQPLEVVGLKIVPGPAGDYNGDGNVDAADYTVWRDNRDEGRLPHNEVASVGVVDQGDYEVWRDNFGFTTPNTLQVPSPGGATVLVSLITAALLSGSGRRSLVRQ